MGVKGVRHVVCPITMGAAGSHLEWTWHSSSTRLQTRLNSSLSCREIRWSTSHQRMCVGGSPKPQRAARQAISRAKAAFLAL